ncbi:Tellurium resistance [Nocardia aurea]|uniref:Tellurium resistance n=1 Tax=Nocardia aurea TaxID=2144174 RepID=A0ABV3FMJ5_9NOCA
MATVTLSKATPSVNLTEPGARQGVMRAHLRWSSRPRGLLRRAKPVDLDLGCLYELSDGAKGVVQAVGNNFGSIDDAPYIRLDGDDRTGGGGDGGGGDGGGGDGGGGDGGGETLHIDLTRPELFRRILIFAFIYDGVPNWAAADAVVTLFPTEGPRVEMALDSPSRGARCCAVALLENRGSGIVVNREVNYINGTQRHIDEAYGWGMRWHSTTK